MKSKIILSIALLLCFGITANGQSCPPDKSAGKEAKMDMKPEVKAKQESEKAQARLGLTADQASKWEQAALTRINANLPYSQKMKGSTTPEERTELRSKMKANKEQFDVTVNGFLTSAQKDKYQEVTKEKKSKMHGGMRKRD